MRFNTFFAVFVAAVSCAGAPAFAAPVDLERRAAGQNSVTVTARQDLFDEAIKVVVPIAERIAPNVGIPDQSVSQSLPFIGDQEVAAARNIRLESMDIGQLQIPLDSGKLRFQVNDVAIKLGTDVSILGGGIGRVDVFVTASIGGSVFIRNNGAGALVADVQDVSTNINRFDFNIPIPVFGSAIGFVNSLFNEQIRGLVAGVASQPIDDAMTQVLNQVLATQLKVEAAVQGVPFNFNGEFVGEPVVTADGLTASVAVIGSVNA
ncbi:hypothetical protein HK102_009068 [Quaeritorhiza haematococci]|nr:hypothetical protein HK102_009068 [Quaeritorhiza haematococci]